jgi:hypothetical protein
MQRTVGRLVTCLSRAARDRDRFLTRLQLWPGGPRPRPQLVVLYGLLTTTRVVGLFISMWALTFWI